jgi:DnaK suppressor protein
MSRFEFQLAEIDMASSDSSLDDAFVEQQRKRLIALRHQIIGVEDRTAESARTEQAQNGGEAREYEDAAQDLQQKEIHQAQHEVDARRLEAIERALQKIDDGTYGYSDRSKKAIPRERLEASPEAVLTVNEQQTDDKASSNA